MPLKEGHSEKSMHSNIKELVEAGHPVKKAIAIALATNKKKSMKKMHLSEGGIVEDEDSEYNDGMNRWSKDTSVSDYFDNEDEPEVNSRHPASRLEEVPGYKEDPEDYDFNMYDIQARAKSFPQSVASPKEQDRMRNLGEALMMRHRESELSEEEGYDDYGNAEDLHGPMRQMRADKHDTPFPVTNPPQEIEAINEKGLYRKEEEENERKRKEGQEVNSKQLPDHVYDAIRRFKKDRGRTK